LQFRFRCYRTPWHNAVGFLILALAGLHAAAALLHRYAWKDQVLERMLPRFRR